MSFLNLRKELSVVLFSFIIFGCSNNESNARPADQKIKVADCSIDFDDVNFCSEKRMREYSKIILTKKYNFDQNKNLHFFRNNDQFYFSIIDINKKKVYSFPASLKNNEENFLDFNLNSNIFCLKGDFNQYQNSYQNVKSCYSFEDGVFHLKNRDDLILKQKDIQVKTIKLPNASDDYSKCREMKSESYCKKQADLNDFSYSKENLNELSGKVKITNVIKELNADSYRLISYKDDIRYIIAEKYVENDESVSAEYFLIKNNSVLRLGDYYTIDKLGVLKYSDNKKIKLF